MNIVITAHAAIRKFEQPDEMGAYDRWELKLINAPKCTVCAMLKEWADMVIFANYKTFAVAVDKEGKKHKAQGGERTMYTSHTPCWDAKNRFDLPPELPFDFGQIAHLFGGQTVTVSNTETVQKTVQQTTPQTTAQPKPQEQPGTDGFEDVTPRGLNIPESLPKALKDLMRANNVDESDIILV